jgi:hypothetical protein
MEQTRASINAGEAGPTPFVVVLSYSTKPLEPPVHNGILSRPENTRRDENRPRLTWEEVIKRYLK